MFLRLVFVPVLCVLPVASISLQTPPSKPTLALLTFDLDDTLFPVAQVVEDANTAMIRAFWDAGYTEATNDRIVQHTKMIRRKQRKLMTYTQLRKRAIQTELELIGTKNGDPVDYDLVTTIYDSWLQARHQSAERYLFTGAIEMLQDVKTKFPDVCIGAITNGRGNPLNMTNTLAPYFDFCVSGEDDGVHPERKPHRGIYKVSLAEYRNKFPNDLSETHVWVHVGDCLANDVGASAKMGAYAVWVDLDDLKEEATTATSVRSKPPNQTWSTAPEKVVHARQKLANKSRGFVSAKVTTLSQLPNVVDTILHKAHKESLFGMARKRGRSLD
jgi:FMN phosphatase YigB (HAD superfamily)